MYETLPELVEAVRNYRGEREGGLLAYEVKMFLWATYDPEDELLYPTIQEWDGLLKDTIVHENYSALDKDEVLSILFGLIHRNRIIEGLWWNMFEEGVILKLFEQLIALNTK